MIKSKKQMYLVIGAFALVLMLGTVTYAFFNYTRTGSSNVLKVGKISFNSEQGQAINLTNMFPIDVSNGIPNDATKVGSVTINVTGDTTYGEGIEYLLKAVSVNNTAGTKSLPISIDVSYTATTNKTIGTEDEEYFDKRGENISYYKILAKDTVSNNDQLVVGYIAPNTSVDGKITIKAYIDKAKIVISDTYNDGNTPTDNLGTPVEFGTGKTVLTTSEWNSLQENGVSFQVQVEANEGTWVEEVRSINAMNTFPTVITDEKANIKEVYFNKMGATRMQNSYDNATIKADLTYNNEGKVLAWLETNSDDNTKYNLIVASDGDTYLTTGYGMFKDWILVDKMEFNNINTTRVDQMSMMFMNCVELESIDLSNFDTSSTRRIAQMFAGCSKLEIIDLSNLYIKNIDIGLAAYIFNDCSKLKTIYVDPDKWDLSNQPNGMGIFSNNNLLVGGVEPYTTLFDNSRLDKNMAVVSNINHEGYLTDIADKPNN